MTGYPWSQGDLLLANDLNAAIANSVALGGGMLPLTGGTMTGPLFYTATGGTTPRSAQNRAADVANVLDYGAVGNQSTDDTAAIQAALNTGKSVYCPRGTYRLTNTLTVGNSTRSQTLYGDSHATVFYVDTRFSGTATAVFSLQGAETCAPTLRDFDITFIQPGTFTRAGMMTISAFLAAGNPANTGIQYPVAIDQNTSNRFHLERLRISAGWIGINATSAGWWMRDIEESCLNIGLNFTNVPNTGDFCHLHGWHHWNFGINFSGTPFPDGQSIAISMVSGGGGVSIMEDLNLFVTKLHIDVGSGETKITNLSLDTSCCEIVSGAWVEIVNIYTSSNNTDQASFTLSGGAVSLVNAYGWPASGRPYVLNTGANLQMFGGRPEAVGTDVPVLDLRGGFTSLMGVAIAGTSSYTTSWPVSVSGGILNMIGCRIAGVPTPNIGALHIATDNAQHVVVGNQWNTLSFTPPGNLGCYGPNTGSGSATGTHFPSNPTFDSGLNFGSTLDPSPGSTANHIALFGSNYGIGVTANRVNYNSNGSHVFMLAGTDFATLSQTGCALAGTNTNNNAAAGQVGEVISSTVGNGTPISLTSPTTANVTTISLTAGDWDVGGEVGFINTTNQCSVLLAGISNVSAAIPGAGSGQSNSLVASSGIFGNCSLPITRTRMSLSATTTIYLIAGATFATGAAGAYGHIEARRVR